MDAQEGTLVSAIFQEENAANDLTGALVGARLGGSREIIIKSVDEGTLSLSTGQRPLMQHCKSTLPKRLGES